MTQRDFVVKRDPIVSLHDALLKSRGGISAAAKAIGRSPGVLHNKFSESMPHYELTVREAISLASSVADTSFVAAVCDQFDGVFLRLPEGKPGDDDVLQDYLDIVQNMGDLSREFTEARTDGIIDPDEFNALRLRTHRTVAALMQMLGDIEQMVRDVPPQPSLKAVGQK